MKNTKEIEKSLELAIASLDRDLGKNSVVKLGSGDIEPWPAISTGALTLDVALGIGGFPRGRIVEVFGPEGTGKSTLCLNVIAEAQKMGLNCLFVDAEHALDPSYAKNLGVNLEDLLLAQPDHGEAALQIVDRLMGTKEIGVVIVDSVAGLTPKSELEGQIGDSHVGQLPRLMSQAMRMLVGSASKTNTLIIFTNQIREKIGVMYGNPETQPGGRALKFAASVRIDLRKIEDIKAKDDGSKTGIRVRARVIKNKMAPPYVESEYDILYGSGINVLGCVLDVAEKRGIISKGGGGYYSYNGSTLAQGRDKALEVLAADLAFVDELKGLISGT